MIDLFASESRPVDSMDGVYVRTIPADVEVIRLLLGNEPGLQHRIVELATVDAEGNRLVPDGKACELPMATLARLAIAAAGVPGNNLSEPSVEDAEGN